MKNLRNYSIRVTNDLERAVARTFYKRATHKADGGDDKYRVTHIGIGTHLARNAKNKVYGGILGDNETSVDFIDIDTLADTPSRKAALEYAFKKHAFVPTYEVKTPKAPKTPSKLLPIVSFGYPLHGGPVMKFRLVRVVKMDATNILGYEIDPTDSIEDVGTFKKFKCSKITNRDIRLVRFN